MKKIIGIVMTMLLWVGLCCGMSTYAASGSLEYNIKGMSWLEDGKIFVFDSTAKERFLNGKLYLNEAQKGNIMVQFYNQEDGSVTTFSKIVTANPDHRDFIGYRFDLDDLVGSFKVRVSATSSTWGWLNY